MKPVVAIVECCEYDQKKIKNALFNGLKAVGWQGHEWRGKECILKPNLLAGRRPELAITTHPALVAVIAGIAKAGGGKILIGDSPGGPFNQYYLRSVYKETQMDIVAKETGAELNFNTSCETLPCPWGWVSKSFSITSYLRPETGRLLINLPKMKTHGLTRLTGAVKNLFGVVPGLLKAEYHLKMSDVPTFSRMLVDLARTIKPALNIVDGITAMEGEGPAGGDPRPINRLIISRDPFALDVVLAVMIGIEPISVPTIAAAGEVGLPSSLADLDLVGNITALEPAYKVPPGRKESILLERYLPERAVELAKKLLQPFPIFKHDACTGCEICQNHCPPGIISGAGAGKPEIRLKECIRCFCCQELCPNKAVHIYRPFLGRIFFR